MNTTASVLVGQKLFVALSSKTHTDTHPLASTTLEDIRRVTAFLCEIIIDTADNESFRSITKK